MAIDDNTKLEILSDHYNETFELQKSNVERRDRLFLYILVLLGIILLYVLTPNVIGNWIDSFIKNQINNQQPSNTSPVINTSFIGAILWFGLLSLTHTYFQSVLHVQRQYDYIYNLEEELSRYFDDKAFIREGKHYEKYKLKFSSWTKIIFWNLFPLMLLVFVIFWLVFLFSQSNAPLGYLIIDSLISLSILISEGLYLWALYRRK